MPLAKPFHALCLLMLAALAGLRPVSAWATEVAVRALNEKGREVEIDIGGTWRGGLSHDGRHWPFKMELNIRVQGGHALNGMAKYVSAANDGQLVEKFVGRAGVGTFSFTEMEVVQNQTTNGWRWCIKEGTGTIRLVGNEIIIRGKWHNRPDAYVYTSGKYTKGRCEPGIFEIRKRYEPVVDEEPEEGQGSPPGLPPPPSLLLNRRVMVVDSFFANSGVISIRYRDGDVVDGDIISLNLNGNHWLGRNLRLRRRYRRLTFRMFERSCYVIMYADHAGRGGKTAQNTAHLRISDGIVSKEREFDSSPATSQAIKIVRQPR